MTPEQKEFSEHMEKVLGGEGMAYYAIQGKQDMSNPAVYHFKVTSNMKVNMLVNVLLQNLRNEIGEESYRGMLLAALEKELGATIVMAEAGVCDEGDDDAKPRAN